MNKQIVKRIIQFLIFLLLLLYVVFNDRGVLSYWKLHKQVENLKEEIKTGDSLIKRYKLKIDSLKKSNKMLERLAREKYQMHKPNEKPLKIEVE